MEYVYGKRTGQLSATELACRIQNFEQVWLDLGTGDGRFVEEMARLHPTTFFIGVDACRENLARVAGRAGSNTLYLIASAENLPLELAGLADHISINFPWGSLLKGLLEPQSKVWANLPQLAARGASLEIRLNLSAIEQAGWEGQAGCQQVQSELVVNGFRLETSGQLDRQTLKTFPSNWAKRLGTSPQVQAYWFNTTRLSHSLSQKAS